MRIGEAIRTFRELLGLTQEELWKRLWSQEGKPVDRKTVSNWENGKTSPTFDIIGVSIPHRKVRDLSEGNAAPPHARLEAGRDIAEEVLPALKKQIWEEILHADWLAAARKVSLAARASDLDAVRSVRDAVLERMRRFCEA